MRRSRRLAVVSALLVIGSSGVCAALAATDGGAGVVALVRGRGWAFVVANAAGGGCRTLLRLPGAASNRILYSSGTLTFAYRHTLVAVRPSGKVRRSSVSSAQHVVAQGVFSPDGRLVVAIRAGVGIYAANGGRLVAAAKPVHRDASYDYASWSKDSRWIAFTTAWVTRQGGVRNGQLRATLDTTELVIMRNDGSDQRVLFRLHGAGVGLSYPQWSPDSQQLALTVPVGRAQAIFVFSRAGGRAHQLTTPRGQAADIGPRWSPNSRRIAFTREFASGNTSSDVYLTDVRSGATARLTRTTTARGASVMGFTEVLAWSSDGAQLLLGRNMTLAAIRVGDPRVRTLCSLGRNTYAQGGAWPG